MNDRAPDRVTLTAFVLAVLPLVAVPLGAWLRDERVSPLFLGGAAVVMAGVYVGVVLAGRRGAPETAPVGAEAA